MAQALTSEYTPERVYGGHKLKNAEGIKNAQRRWQPSPFISRTFHFALKLQNFTGRD